MCLCQPVSRRMAKSFLMMQRLSRWFPANVKLMTFYCLGPPLQVTWQWQHPPFAHCRHTKNKKIVSRHNVFLLQCSLSSTSKSWNRQAKMHRWSTLSSMLYIMPWLHLAFHSSRHCSIDFQHTPLLMPIISKFIGSFISLSVAYSGMPAEIWLTLMICRLHAMTLFAISLYAWYSLWQAYMT